MKKLFFLSTLMTLNFYSFSQDSTTYKIGITENKFIYSGNTIKIFAGQRISVSFERNSSKLVNMKLLDSGKSQIEGENYTIMLLKQNSEKNICIDFNSKKKEDGKFNTLLIVNNPFNDTLTYKAKIYSRKINDYKETSIWDVIPGISGIEHWPYQISDIILYDFAFKK